MFSKMTVWGVVTTPLTTKTSKNTGKVYHTFNVKSKPNSKIKENFNITVIFFDDVNLNREQCRLVNIERVKPLNTIVFSGDIREINFEKRIITVNLMHLAYCEVKNLSYNDFTALNSEGHGFLSQNDTKFTQAMKQSFKAKIKRIELEAQSLHSELMNFKVDETKQHFLTGFKLS